MKSILTLSLLFLVACGGADEATTMDSNQASGGKADDAASVAQVPVSEADADAEEADGSGESLADSFDYCGEFELYDDGTCHRFCYEPDPDCEGVPEPEFESPCDAHEAESDGACSFICQDVDPDCETGPQDSDWEEDEELLDICRSLNAPDYLEDLASAICSGWDDNPTAFTQCVESCLEAQAEG